MPRIPVFVLSGFLGSGKTTLLLRMLQEAFNRGLRPAVLMNELGKQDVDGRLLQEAMPQLNVEKLLDGCLCCSKKSEIAGALQQLLAQKPDCLLVELTGVANPEEIADALTEPQLLRRVKLISVITVLDAEHVLEYNSIFASDRQLVHTLRRQIEVADWLVLNKIDRVGEKERKAIEKAVRKQNERAPLLPTAYSEIDLQPLYSGIAPLTASSPPAFNSQYRPAGAGGLRAAPVSRSSVPVGPQAPREPQPSFSRLRTLVLDAGSAHVTEAQIERFLHKWRHCLLRAKGCLFIGGTGRLIQYAGQRASWQPSEYRGEPYLVLIGLDMDAAALEQDWRELPTRR